MHCYCSGHCELGCFISNVLHKRINVNVKTKIGREGMTDTKQFRECPASFFMTAKAKPIYIKYDSKSTHASLFRRETVLCAFEPNRAATKCKSTRACNFYES